MASNVTVYDLMRRFENELRRMEQTDPEYAPGPYFPMLAVFLGDDAIRTQPMISGRLNQFWPQFGPEVTFLGLHTIPRPDEHPADTPVPDEHPTDHPAAVPDESADAEHPTDHPAAVPDESADTDTHPVDHTLSDSDTHPVDLPDEPSNPENPTVDNPTPIPTDNPTSVNADNPTPVPTDNPTLGPVDNSTPVNVTYTRLAAFVPQTELPSDDNNNDDDDDNDNPSGPDEVSPETLNRIVSELFSPDAPFARYDKLLVYEFLDTSSFTSAEQVRTWLDALCTFRRDLHMEPGRVCELLTVLLDEAPEKRELAVAIRHELAAYLTDAVHAAETAAAIIAARNAAKSDALSTDSSDTVDTLSGDHDNPSENDGISDIADDIPADDTADADSLSMYPDDEWDDWDDWGEAWEELTLPSDAQTDDSDAVRLSNNHSDAMHSPGGSNVTHSPGGPNATRSPGGSNATRSPGGSNATRFPDDSDTVILFDDDDWDDELTDAPSDMDDEINGAGQEDPSDGEYPAVTVESPTILILSSHRSDRRIATGPRLRIGMACALMTLSNSPDTDLSDAVFTPALLTAAYAREEKPLRAISQICVTELLAELRNAAPQSTDTPYNLDDFRTRLGISADGTFVFFDTYVSETLSRYLPTRAQLTRFPFFAPGEELRLDTETVSAAQFNEWTFGAWNCWLTGAVRRAQDQIRRDMADFRRWREQYANLLRTRFTADELIWLATHPHRAAKLLSSAQVPSRDLPVLEYAQAWLKYMVSSSQGLTGVLREEIEKQGEQARLCREQWDTLSRQTAALRPIRDENLSRAYRRVLHGYFDICRENLTAGFRAAKTSQELLGLIDTALQNLLRDRTLGLLFRADLTGELEYRMRVARLDARTVRTRTQSDNTRTRAQSDNIRTQSPGTASTAGTNSPANDMEGIREETEARLRQRLCDAPVYLPVLDAVGESVCRGVLLDLDTSFYDELADNLPPDTRFYDTGRSGSAEFVELFRLNPDAL